MELRGPVRRRVRLQALVEPRALELERLLGRHGLAAARLLEDAAHLGLRVGRGEHLRDAVVAHHAAGLREKRVARGHRGEEVVPGLHGRLRGGGELVHPRVPRLRVLDLRRLVAAPRGQDLRAERLFRDGEVVLEGVDGVVRRADHLHVRLLHEPARREVLPAQLRVALLPDLRRRRGRQALRHPEVARELEVGPVEERVLEQALHRGGERVELLLPGRVARHVLLVHAVRAHLAPLVVVAAQPHLGDVLPTLVARDLRRRQVAVVVDDRHLLRIAVVELLGRLRGQQEIVVDERHVCFSLCFWVERPQDYTTPRVRMHARMCPSEDGQMVIIR